MKSALALINTIHKKDRPKRNGFLYRQILRICNKFSKLSFRIRLNSQIYSVEMIRSCVMCGVWGGLKYDKQTNLKCAHFLQANGFSFYIKHKLLVNFDLWQIKDQTIRIYSTWKGKQVETVIKLYHRRYIIHYHDYIGNFQQFTQLSL